MFTKTFTLTVLLPFMAVARMQSHVTLLIAQRYSLALLLILTTKSPVDVDAVPYQLVIVRVRRFCHPGAWIPGSYACL